jgi:hypothetical protein
MELENDYIFTSKRQEKYSCVLPTPQTTYTVKETMTIENYFLL